MVAKNLPLSFRRFFPGAYCVSLSLVAGHGFQMFDLSLPEARALTDFLVLQRDQVSEEELQSFFGHPRVKLIDSSPDEADLNEPLSQWGFVPLESKLITTRVLDVYVAALLWKLFGVSWQVLFTFYSLVSTLCCFLVFLMARQLGRAFWPGLFAALLYLAAPLENLYTAISIRDISPLWFAIISFFMLINVVERFRSWKLNLAAFAAVGAVATLGCGWRQDALLLAPFILVTAILYLIQQRRSWRYVTAAAVLFLAGAGSCKAAISGLCPFKKEGSQVSFHMAYYGEYSRCNVLGLENSFQISRDDVQTYFMAQYRNAIDHPGSSIHYLGDNYGSNCRAMYQDAVQYNVFHWVLRFPEFYCQALAASDGSQLPIDGIPARPAPLKESSDLWPPPGQRFVLDWLSDGSLWFFVVGIGAVLFVCPDKVRAGSLVVFSVFYAGVLWAVLPEYKHAGSLLLPITVLGGVGLWTLLKLARPSRWGPIWRLTVRPSLPRMIWIGALAVTAWSAACAGAYYYSVAYRDGYLRRIMTLAAAGTNAPGALKDCQTFSVRLGPGDDKDPVGYLLKIQAGEHGGSLTCSHIRFWQDFPGTTFVTEHRLHPDRLQHFFVTCLQGARFGDPRPYVCKATLAGDATFLSCTQVDLATWKGLPVSTVFCEGEHTPGSPVLGKPASESNVYYLAAEPR
jgi:hypothetical protein